MPAHAPAPWHFDGYDSVYIAGHAFHEGGHVYTHKDGSWNAICLMYGNNPEMSDFTRGEVEANALLVSMAPDLLRALRLASDAMNYMGNILNRMDAVTLEDEAATTEAFTSARSVLKKLADVLSPEDQS